MRRASLAAVIAISAMLLSGCTASEWGPGGATEDDWKDLPATTAPSTQWSPDRTQPRAATASDSIIPDACNNSVAVIGIGDPGHGNKVEQHLYYAVDFIGQQILKADPTNPRRISVSLHEIGYEEGTKAVTSIDQAASAERGQFTSSVLGSGPDILSKMDEIEKKCPGTHIVLRGHGWGAFTIRSATASMDSYQKARISAIWLSSDPGRIAGEDIAVVPDPPQTGDIFAVSKVLQGDPTAGGLLPNSGRVPNFSGGFSDGLKDRVVTVCYSTDPVCNGGDSDLKEFLSKNGGAEAAWLTHGYKYAGLPVASPAAEWVTGLVEVDVKEGAKNSVKADSKLAHLNPLVAGYLNYVNTYSNDGVTMRHAGARVVQESIEPGAVVNQCADYTVMGVRGSGENIDGNTQDDKGNRQENIDGYKGGKAPHTNAPVIAGFSEFLATYSWEIKTQLDDDKTIRFVPVSYPAAPVSTLGPGGGKGTGEPWTISDADSFMASAATGADMLRIDMVNLQIKCPDTKIVLIGYSQGAMAVHKALLAIGHTDLTNQIAAVLLVSDPLRINSDTLPLNYLPRDNPLEFTDFSFLEKNSLGAGIGMVGEFGNVKFNDRLKGKIVQICDLSDIVCNASPALAWGEGFSTHTSAYSNKSHYEFPADWAVQRLESR